MGRRRAVLRTSARPIHPDFHDDANAPAVARCPSVSNGLPLGDGVSRRDRPTPARRARCARPRAPAARQTLRATIDWSHTLLGQRRERWAFARFAPAAPQVEAAEASPRGARHARGSGGEELLVRSMHPRAPTRVWMLDTVHAYATSALPPWPMSTPCARITIALPRARPAPWERAGAVGTDGRTPRRLDVEIENLKAALGWAVGQPSAEQALEIAAALGLLDDADAPTPGAAALACPVLSTPMRPARPRSHHEGQAYRPRGVEPSNARSWKRRRRSRGGLAIR